MQTPNAPLTDACRQRARTARYRGVDQFEQLGHLLLFLLLLPEVCLDMAGKRLGVDHLFALRTSLFRIGALPATRVFATMKTHVLVEERTIEFLSAVRTWASQF